MRKIYLMILSILPIFMTIQCQNTVITPPSETITDFIDELVPNVISETTLLPEEHGIYELVWYLDGVLLENNLLVRPFQLTDSTHVVKMEVSTGMHSKSFQKFIEFTKYDYVSEIRIETDNMPIDKDNYVIGSVTLINSGETLNTSSMRIKGRGNSTWWLHDKKPYRIKFDERQSLLGMKSAKDYVFLAEYGDKSLLRNYIAMKIAETSNLEYVIETRFVEIYLNGYYEGLYLMTEQIEIDQNRLSIDDSYRHDGGFMVELETWDRLGEFGVENVEWVQAYDRAYMIKHPDADDYTTEQMNAKAGYIKDYLKSTYDSMLNNTYADFIDVNQFIDYFIIQELTKNVDVNYSSVFMYKDYGGKLKMGPLWDFDISMGNGDYYPSEPQGFWAIGHPYLNRMLQNSAFKAQYKQRLWQFLALSQTWLNELDLAYQLISSSAVNNFGRWDILYSYVWPNTQEMVDRHTHLEQYEYLRDWIVDRVAWIKSNINTL